MTDIDQDPGLERPATGRWPLVIAVLLGGAFATIFGLAFAINPLAVLGAIIGLAFMAATFIRPLWGFAAALLAQVIVPLYVGLPLVPFLPAFPASLIVLAIAAAIVFLRTEPVQRRGFHPITLAFAAYGAALALSIVLSSTPASTFNPFVRCFAIPFMAYLMTRRLVRSPGDAILPLNTLLLGAVIASFYAVVEFGIGWNPLIENLTDPDLGDLDYWNQSPSRGSPNIYRSFSFEMNPLFFATITSMLLPYAVARFGVAESWQGKFIFGAAACICLAGIVTTFSRGALLAVALSMIGLAVMLPRVRYIVGVPLVLGVLAGLAALPWLGPAIWARLSDSDNVSLRFKLWQIAWHMFLDNPFTGVGLNGFAHHQLAVLRTYEIGPFPEYSGGELEKLGTADNTFLQLAAETGAAGAAAFAALFSAAAASLARNLNRRHSMSRVIAGSTAAAVVAYLINGLTINGYTAYAPTIILSILLAITASIGAAAENPCPARSDNAGPAANP